jgi:hypothetical protein
LALAGQTSALVVRKTKAAAAELSPQNAILFAQVFDRVRLLLVHPTGERNEEKSIRVQGSLASFRKLPLLIAPLHSCRLFSIQSSFWTLRDRQIALSRL